MIVTNFCFKQALLVGTCLWGLCSALFAQNKDLDRDFEPVVLQGDCCSEFRSVTLQDIWLYAYRANTQIWQQIPLQIDERDDEGNYFGQDNFPGLDETDDIVFMAKDAGDLGRSSWVDDDESKTHVRYEFEVRDPLTNKVGWVYLYRSTDIILDENLADYIDHFNSVTSKTGEDRIVSDFYEVANDTTGFPKDLILADPGDGKATDFLDLLKLRATVLAGGLFPLTVTEQNVGYWRQGDFVDIREGRVRVIRKSRATIMVAGVPIEWLQQEPTFYYPYSLHLNLEVPHGAPGSSNTVQDGRLTIDLNENAATSTNLSGNSSAAGLKFVSAMNAEPGFTVDGIDDPTMENSLSGLLPDDNWVYIGGSDRTIVHLFPFDPMAAGADSLYYLDDSSVSATDTGDLKSYGDTGVSLYSTVNPPLTVAYTGYYLNSTQSSSIGSQIAEWERNPFQITVDEQNIGSVPVELVSFLANTDRNNVQLVWVTATETNNFGFDIESRRESLGKWQKVAFIPGNGTTTTPVHYEYKDRNLQSATYEYRLKQIDTDGAFEYSDIVLAVVGVPETFALSQNFPNPFNPNTAIQYQLPLPREQTGAGARTLLSVYNLLGQEVGRLVDREQPAGYYTVSWAGQDEDGLDLPSGVYIYRLQSRGLVQTRKMILAR